MLDQISFDNLQFIVKQSKIALVERIKERIIQEVSKSLYKSVDDGEESYYIYEQGSPEPNEEGSIECAINKIIREEIFDSMDMEELGDFIDKVMGLKYGWDVSEFNEGVFVRYYGFSYTVDGDD